MGVPIAWRKVAQGKQVEWIGAQISFKEQCLSISIPEKKIAELRTTIDTFLDNQVVTKVDILKLAGKLSYLAGLIIYLKAFLAPLWATSAGRGQPKEGSTSRTPRHLIHVKRIRPTLVWLKAFFTSEPQCIIRKFHVNDEEAVPLSVATDASTMGMGGILLDSTSGKPIQYFSTPITAEDEKILGTQRGQSKGMPIWESLALLIALRTWSLPGERLRISITGDSLGVLQAMVKQASNNPMVNRVIQEVALDLACERYSIGSVTHIKSAANYLPDKLSRMHDAEATNLPAELSQVPRRQVALRDSAFWHVTESKHS